MASEAIMIRGALPDVETCLALRRAVGWPVPEADALARALSGTLYSVIAEVAGRTVGMTRVLGDGVLCFLVQDLIVHPDYQRQGVGTRLMDAAMAYIDSHAARKAYVALFSARGLEHFYERYGFVVRPSASGGSGMVYFRA